MVAAAKVEPLHALHVLAEALFKRCDCAYQIVCVLLAQGVEVQAVDAGQQLGLEIFLRDAQTGVWAAGVVDCVLGGLGRALRVDAQAAAFASRTRKAAIGLPLGERVEHNVVGVVQQLLKFALGIGRGVDVGLAAEFLVSEPRFVQAGRGGACQIFTQQRIDCEHGKRLLCE